MMNILKLNTIVISSVALLGVEAAHAKAKPVVRDGVVPMTARAISKLVQPTAAVRKASSVASSLKRTALLSVGGVTSSLGDVASDLESAGYGNAIVSESGSSDTFALGYRLPINSRWGVDLTYVDTGEISANFQAAPAAGKTGAQTAKDVAKSLPIYGNGLNYVALRHMPLSRNVSLQAGAGLFIWSNDREATVDGIRHVEEDSGVNLTGQLGLSFTITPRFNIELKAQRFFMPGDDVDRASLGIALGF